METGHMFIQVTVLANVLTLHAQCVSGPIMIEMTVVMLEESGNKGKLMEALLS